MQKLNKNDKGFAHWMIIAAVVVTGVIGLVGYKVYQAKYGVNAKAYYWSSYGSGEFKVYACKISNTMKYFVKNSTGYTATVTNGTAKFYVAPYTSSATRTTYNYGVAYQLGPYMAASANGFQARPCL